MKLGDKSVTVVIPTRGDVNLSPLIMHLRSYSEVALVWSVASDTPFSRYLLAWEAPTQWVYTQDDDCLTDLQPILNNPRPGYIVNAMTEDHAAQYPGRQTLLGFGALFERRLIKPLLDDWERDELFLRESDRVFGTIVPHQTFYPEITILPCATAPNRFYRQAEHVPSRVAIEKRIFERTGLAPR